MGQKGENTKTQIRRTALELFVQSGYSRVTMQDICTRTGLSKGGLYRHYEDKAQIFIDILKEMQQEEAGREEELMRQDRSAVRILDAFLEHTMREVREPGCSINRAVYEFCVEHKDGEGPEILSGQYNRGEAILHSLIAYGINRKEFQTANPPGAAASILFLLEGLRMAGEVMPISDRTLEGISCQIRQILGV